MVKLQNGEGMLQIAIRTDAIEELAVNFNKYGLHTIGHLKETHEKRWPAFRMENVIC